MQRLASMVFCTTCLAIVIYSCAQPPKANRNDTLNGVIELNLKDGTHCVAYYSYAITCDWKHQ